VILKVKITKQYKNNKCDILKKVKYITQSNHATSKEAHHSTNVPRQSNYNT